VRPARSATIEALLSEWRDDRGLVTHLDFIGALEVGQFSDQHIRAPGELGASP
jgi:hypothetical protein